MLESYITMGHNGNPMSFLKVHQLSGTPVLFSDIATLVLSKPGITVIDSQFILDPSAFDDVGEILILFGLLNLLLEQDLLLLSLQRKKILFYIEELLL